MKVIPSDSLLKNRQEKVSEKLCADCNSLCCHDLVMEIAPPKNESELNTLKWYLHFRHSFIFIYENIYCSVSVCSLFFSLSVERVLSTVFCRSIKAFMWSIKVA